MSSLFACIYGYLLYNSDFEKEFTIEVIKQTHMFLWFALIFFYILERSFKTSFLQQKKIEGLIQEHMKLLDLLPDGLVMHSQESKNEAEGTTEQSISYFNKMFRQMFRDIGS